MLWRPESPGADYRAYFDLFFPAVTVALGAPLAAAAGFLLSRQGVARVAGYAALLLTGLVLAYLSSFAFFGGFCLDPGEACITSWPSRVAHLAVAVGCVAAGWAVERWASGRTVRRTRATLT